MDKDFLTVNVTSSSRDEGPVKTQQKLIFDGKEREATVFGSPREESTATWSDDGQTMIVNSVKTLYSEGKTSIKVREVGS